MKSSSDLVQHREHPRRRRQIAHSDDLTGLPNRALLGELLQKAIAQSKRWGHLLAVVRLNLNGMQAIRDRHGNDIADLVMASLGRAMKRILRKGDTLARLDGNEFAAILTALDETQASAPVLNRLLKAAAEPVTVADSTFQLSACIGVAFYPQDEDADADQLLHQASQAMHRASATGDNHYHFYDSARDVSVGGHPESPESIRQALAAREFALYYQPKVNMRTGKVVGAEALIRWLHPKRGLMQPAEFLPVIQDHPLAIELGEWVIGAALDQAEKWFEAGLGMIVSVNVGARQLRDPGFADRLVKILAEHPRIQPSSLELDITESHSPEDAAQLLDVLKKCRDTGVTFALDDFGTGHFSLSELKQMPIDVLKIDPSFVREILEDPDALMILDGVLGLVAGFQRQAVAEGVETVEQGLMLLRLGCEMAQGYGIAQPMLAEKFPEWAAAWRPDPRWTDAVLVSQDERPLIYAGVEHRVWAAALEAFLKGESDVEPRLSRHQCQFGAWLYAEGPAGHSSRPAFQAIVALHWRIHALATGIMKFQTQGRNEEGLARLGELKDLVDKLADLLNASGQRDQEAAS
ncbi:MAG: EAL domain-containing protein [Terracidiphilus sp.]|jgi:diguanylate cyclase (GGDEF)-like protein